MLTSLPRSRLHRRIHREKDLHGTCESRLRHQKPQNNRLIMEAMVPHRIAIKYFLVDPQIVDLPAFVPVFHRWIREQAVEGLLIDVANYMHLHHGPGVRLIGHEGDYAIDSADGRPGLSYVSKRGSYRNLRDLIRSLFRRVLEGYFILEAEVLFKTPVAVRTDEVELVFLDRMKMPNRESTLELVRDDLQDVIAELYQGSDFTVHRIHEDPRRPFSLRLLVSNTPDLSVLRSRLGIAVLESGLA